MCTWSKLHRALCFSIETGFGTVSIRRAPGLASATVQFNQGTIELIFCFYSSCFFGDFLFLYNLTNTRVWCSWAESPCQLDCKPDNEFYSVKLRETVIDGTPCKPGTRDMCIHGVCKVRGGSVSVVRDKECVIPYSCEPVTRYVSYHT